jgi:hypothetical protein
VEYEGHFSWNKAAEHESDHTPSSNTGLMKREALIPLPHVLYGVRFSRVTSVPQSAINVQIPSSF